MNRNEIQEHLLKIFPFDPIKDEEHYKKAVDTLKKLKLIKNKSTYEELFFDRLIDIIVDYEHNNSDFVPNDLTMETIEKALRGEDVETVDGVKELFEDLEEENEGLHKLCEKLERLDKKLFECEDRQEEIIDGLNNLDEEKEKWE